MKFKETEMEPSGEFAAAIRDFRAAVTHVANREAERSVAAGWLAPARKRRRTHQHRMILAWACAAALCFATLPFAIHSRPGATSAVANTAAAPILRAGNESDSALLDQVDADLSESVPSSLAPLAELENWSAASANTSGDSSLDGTSFAQPESTDVAH